MDEGMWVGTDVEGCSFRFFTKVSVIEVAGIVFISARAEEIDLIEIVVAVPSGIAVKTGVNAINKQTAAGDVAFENIPLVAVLNKEELVGVGAWNHVSVASSAFPNIGFQLVGAECIGVTRIDDWYLVNPIAVFVFQIDIGLLWRLGGAAH